MSVPDIVKYVQYVQSNTISKRQLPWMLLCLERGKSYTTFLAILFYSVHFWVWHCNGQVCHPGGTLPYILCFQIQHDPQLNNGYVNWVHARMDGFDIPVLLRSTKSAFCVFLSVCCIVVSTPPQSAPLPSLHLSGSSSLPPLPPPFPLAVRFCWEAPCRTANVGLSKNSTAIFCSFLFLLARVATVTKSAHKMRAASRLCSSAGRAGPLSLSRVPLLSTPPEAAPCLLPCRQIRHADASSRPLRTHLERRPDVTSQVYIYSTKTKIRRMWIVIAKCRG